MNLPTCSFCRENGTLHRLEAWRAIEQPDGPTLVLFVCPMADLINPPEDGRVYGNAGWVGYDTARRNK